MLKKSLRYTTAEFKEVFSNNQQTHGSYFIRLSPSVGLLANRPDLINKYAVVVSKKTYKRRVDRNLVRRFFYRYINNQLQQDDHLPGGIVMLRKGKVDFVELIKEKPAEATEKLDEIYSN